MLFFWPLLLTAVGRVDEEKGSGCNAVTVTATFSCSFLFVSTFNLITATLSALSCANFCRSAAAGSSMKMERRRSFPAVALPLLAVWALVMVVPCFAGDPYAYFDWDVSFITAAPLGVKQQVIGINGQFPGPVVNVTTNWNVVVNVLNDLDEPLLITWNGIQHRKNSWQDGVQGTNCPIPSGWNWTYQFQVKDQIGSFFYFPSTGFQRAAGGYGGFIVNNRDVIAVPFDKPHGDITLFVGDWYNKDYKARSLNPVASSIKAASP
ncbi:Multicopper oxidase [Musa troglodytarum]|uniref:Multicopper oxidase n=1 Tax=Musa troglodytarum TaxID=320322 RepID=A0A9E7JI40_9LILI|nr:Multicopper oxidase [Musa troglodytarum]